MEALIGRLVVAQRPIENLLGESITVKTQYGRIIKISMHSDKPFLVETILDDGTTIRDWYSGYAIDCIR